jgi:hypothetical protein
MEVPGSALELAVMLVDYRIARDKTYARFRTKTWMARHKYVKLVPP